MLPLEKSLAMQMKAKKIIPGMTQLLSKRPDMFSLGVWPGYYSRAKGCTVWDLDGNEYTDMSISGIGANILGYADDEVDEAVIEAIHRGSSSSLNCPEEVELAELLCELHPWASMARFTRSGGEAMAVAVRIARAHTNRDKVAFCGYHGWHDWYLAANLGTENALGEHLITGLDPRGVPQGLKGTAFPFRFNQLEELESIVSSHGKELAAIVFEPIRNTTPTQEFVQGVKDIADACGVVLIVDEISSGFRMNTGGAHLILGYNPDIAVFSKSLGNGYPIGAIIGKSEVMQSAQNTFISSTCWTERTGPAAALATIRKHRRENVGAHLMKLGQSVQDGWRSLLEKHGIPAGVSGMPPMSHIDFETQNPLETKALFIQLMLERGYLASNLFYAMHAHSDEAIGGYFEATDASFKEIASAISAGNVSEKLKGSPSATGFRRLT
ncbi:MAG: aminotransferase class III-fold pyridoxal phosphate-dependent enzyme [Aminivibrio sp.]|jgi:glutamate-1-semialdehyde 2,1-aminomutase